MSQAAHHKFSFLDYLRVEDDSGIKHEFFDGQVWAMAGGSPEHAAVAANVIAILGVALRGKPCRVYRSDLRVRVKATGLVTYPDVSVVCGQVERDPEDPKGHTVVNPTVLIEILSPSTEAYDRADKLVQYQTIGSLRDVMFVAHDRQEVTVLHRHDDGGWSTSVTGKGGVARLPSLGTELPIDEIYRDPFPS
jgi:Uma2 family endonuclease